MSDGVPPQVARALAACAGGEAPATIILMRLTLQASSGAEVEGWLAAEAARRPPDSEAHARLAAALALWRANPQAYPLLHAVAGGIDHGAAGPDPASTVAALAAGFDRASALSPEAGVALYSLGNPALLAAASQEIIALLESFGLLGPDVRVLDIGCGAGRMEEALSPLVGQVTGLDVSGGMLAVARQRCRNLGNVAFLQGTGRDLSGIADASVDLVLAIDSFPYLVQAGADLAGRHIEEARRVLRGGGEVIILNYSYRGDLACDRVEVNRLAREIGFSVLAAGTRDLRLWDGTTFRLRFVV